MLNTLWRSLTKDCVVPPLVNVKLFIKELEEKVHSSFCHRWCNHLDTSEHLSMNNNYKHCSERERYVDVLWMEVYRNSLVQFRMGVSQINLYTHRFSKTTDNTACPFCANLQETEIHFVFQCPMHNQLRSEYLPVIINVRHRRKHLITLMNSSSRETIVNVAKFLVCAFNPRSSKLDANTWVSPYVDIHRAVLQTCVLMCIL